MQKPQPLIVQSAPLMYCRERIPKSRNVFRLAPRLTDALPIKYPNSRNQGPCAASHKLRDALLCPRVMDGIGGTVGLILAVWWAVERGLV